MMWGRLLHNALHYFTQVLYMRYFTGHCTPYSHCFQSMFFNVSVHRVKWTPFGGAAKHKLREGLKMRLFFLSLHKGGKKLFWWTREDKARLHSCYGNSCTPISPFAVCAIIFVKQDHTIIQIFINGIQDVCNNETIPITVKKNNNYLWWNK